ncbi:EEF1A lysine methyltransferase 4-like [Oppia nitens]|uniref:EEF1A lysine methyltransferase 4-like n=1 Tax=Oppia nitens TaxID=1686743 RepID=UPI0023DC7304|nr:EEF1A lysine methyltransferase 4-like [Oppia nitens]
MSSSLIPNDNHMYNSVDYWDKRYESVGQRADSDNESYDWLVDYSNIKHIINQLIPKTASLLMLGCGNSLLSEQMFADGYCNIVNIDYSSPVIKQMSNHCDNCRQMQWSVMDCRELTFATETFDVVIEKATIDALLTEETDHWNISDTNRQQISRVLQEVYRVLKTDGQFISISFYGSHFRYPLYKSCFESNTDRLAMKAIHEVSASFHYYCYQLIKCVNKTIDFEPQVYEPPKVITTCLSGNCQSNQLIDDKCLINANPVQDESHYLLNINL